MTGSAYLSLRREKHQQQQQKSLQVHENERSLIKKRLVGRTTGGDEGVASRRVVHVRSLAHRSICKSHAGGRVGFERTGRAHLLLR